MQRSRKFNTPDQLREFIGELNSQIADLNSVLFPVLAQEQMVREAIIRTHRRAHGGSVQFTFDAVGGRRPLYDELLDISRRWGKLRTQRKLMIASLRSCERELERALREEARKTQRRTPR